MALGTITYLDANRRRPRVPSQAPATRVADVVTTAFARVPLWFTVAQARSIAKLKGVRHVLIEERGQVAGTVSLEVLLQAGATDTVARWMTRTQAHVAPELSLLEADQKLRQEGVACLPVVGGGLLVGTVSLEDLGVDVAHAA